MHAKFSTSISRGTISRWFAENNKLLGYLFSHLKCSEENTNYCNNHAKILSACCNNAIFIHKKYSIINNLLKLRVY